LPTNLSEGLTRLAPPEAPPEAAVGVAAEETPPELQGERLSGDSDPKEGGEPAAAPLSPS